jgi:hypothetical protein
VLVQTQILIRPPQIGIAYTSPQFTLASVNAQTGPGFDNIVSLKGYNYGATGGGQWMGFDYVQLNAPLTSFRQLVIPDAGISVGCRSGRWQTHYDRQLEGEPTPISCRENGTINPLPGNPNSPAVNQQADNDYYFAGLYSATIASVVSRYGTNYTPVGLVSTNENAASGLLPAVTTICAITSIFRRR